MDLFYFSCFPLLISRPHALGTEKINKCDERKNYKFLGTGFWEVRFRKIKTNKIKKV